MKRGKAASPKTPLLRLVRLEAAFAARSQLEIRPTGQQVSSRIRDAAPAGIELAPSTANHRPKIGSPSFTRPTGSEQSLCAATTPGSC